jgi:hypothetical protein
MDDLEQQEPAADLDPDAIPRFEWRDGWATFHGVDTLTGADIKRLRTKLDAPGQGTMANDFMGEALRILVSDWAVPGKPDARTPRHDPKVIDRVPGRFLVALEQHIEPYLDFLKKEKAEDDGSVGGP